MKKKQFKTNDDKQFVYHAGRTCRHCNAPISESSTAKREFCPITRDQDGKVRDCKSAYHRKNDKPDRDMFAMITANNKAIFSRIEFLIKATGEDVTTKDLDAYDINLIECLDATTINGLVYWYFIKHVIITNHFTKKHKIERHDKYATYGAIA
jgi:hypothetical protein